MAKLTLVDNRNNKGGDGLFNATDNLAMCDGILSPVLLCKAANNSLIVLPLLIMFHAQQKGEKNTDSQKGRNSIRWQTRRLPFERRSYS
jgi:hypothetical protein